jgi:hypothetical protein
MHKELVAEARANAEAMRREKSEILLQHQESGHRKNKMSGQIDLLEKQM